MDPGASTSGLPPNGATVTPSTTDREGGSPPPPPIEPAPPSGGPSEPAPKRRGRPPLPPGERKQRSRTPPRFVVNPDHPGGMQDTRAVVSVDRDKQYIEASKMLVGTVLSALAMLGDHWRAKSEEETFLSDATYKYMKAKQLPDLPPGWVLLGAVCIYALPRLMHPETERQIAKLMGRNRGEA